MACHQYAASPIVRRTVEKAQGKAYFVVPSVMYFFIYMIYMENIWLSTIEWGIVNRSNDRVINMMHNLRYSLGLFPHVIAVSLETREIVLLLPALDIFENMENTSSETISNAY